jgi:hypothetical protein
MLFARLCFIFLCFSTGSQGQGLPASDTLDLSALMAKVLNKSSNGKSKRGLAILPSVGYNPSMGFMMGANATASTYLGNMSDTRMSTAAATAFVTTKGIINLQLRHNVFSQGNKWMLQGNVQASKMLVIDYGLGFDAINGRSGDLNIMGYPLRNSSGSYPMSFGLFRLNEKVYRRINESLFIGGGINIDLHTGIKEEQLQADAGILTPHYTYSLEKGIDPKRYAANGVMFNIQYNTREHPNRSYGGMYADLVIRSNNKFLGSALNSVQMITEFRKYFSLSDNNPEHILAIWHLGTYRLSGDVPYLDLSGTAGDLYNRSGRGYTIARFKGPSYVYLETEYRFPLSRNKLFSGVLFTNMQTASDGQSVKLFDRLEPSGGGGLRILLKKESRTNICIDYAFGRYGSSGLFFGLNEVF